MHKEIGHYYNLKGKQKLTKIHPIDIQSSNSYYSIMQSSYIEEKSEIHIVHIKENDYQLKINVVYLLDSILTECKVIFIQNKFILFGIGYVSKGKIGKESFFFYEEIRFEEFEEETQLLQINQKQKKLNFVGFDTIEDNVYVISEFSIYRFNFSDLRMELFYELYEKNQKNSFKFITTDVKNRRLYLGIQNSVLVLEEDLTNNFSIENTHDLDVNYIDVNSNKNHQILTTANENFLKFWDIRQTSMPNLIVQEYSSLITSASFNHFYDQLVLYSTENGSLYLYGANSISSSLIMKMSENEQLPENKKLKIYEAALDDYINNVSWNFQDAWVFGSVSNNKVYFDTIPQNIRFEKIISHSLKYPNQNVLGFLIGLENQINDVIPLTHNPINAAIYHISEELIDNSEIIRNGQKIIGLYEISEKHIEDDLLEPEKKILKQIEMKNKLKSSFLISIKFKNNQDNQSRDLMSFTDALKNFSIQKIGIEFQNYEFTQNGLKEIPQEKFLSFDMNKYYKEVYDQGRHLKINDIDDHLDNPNKNFLNTNWQLNLKKLYQII